MDPSRYPWVVTGPSCNCGDARLDHVRRHPVFGHRAADLACTNCANCDQYEPSKPIDRIAETKQYQYLIERKTRRAQVQEKLNWVALGLVVVGVLAAALRPALYPYCIVPAMILALGNSAVSTYFGRREGDLDNGDVAVYAAVTAAVGLFVVALALNAPTSAIVMAVVILFAAVFAFLWRSRQGIVRARRGLDALIADLKASDDLKARDEDL